MSFLCRFRLWFFFLLPQNWNRWPKQRGNVSILKVLTAAGHPFIYSFTISHLFAPPHNPLHTHTKLLSYVQSIVKWFNKIMTFWRISFLLHHFCVFSPFFHFRCPQPSCRPHHPTAMLSFDTPEGLHHTRFRFYFFSSFHGNSFGLSKRYRSNTLLFGSGLRVERSCDGIAMTATKW